MKKSNDFKVLTALTPIIYIPRSLLRQIQYLVAKAPEEAQWYHVVERHETQSNVIYALSEMLIPKQYCSAAEVETTPDFQVEYFNELTQRFGAEAGNVIGRAGAWCHSHVNMGTGPSTTDYNTFKMMMSEAIATKSQTPQIMMIFNKRDEFSSRVFDPVTGQLYDGVDLFIAEETVDTTYLDHALKEKFLKRPRPQVAERSQGMELLSSFGLERVVRNPSPSQGLSQSGSTGTSQSNVLDPKTFRVLEHELESWLAESAPNSSLEKILGLIDRYAPIATRAVAELLYQDTYTSYEEIRGSKYLKDGKTADLAGDLMVRIRSKEYDSEKMAQAIDFAIEIRANPRNVEDLILSYKSIFEDGYPL